MSDVNAYRPTAMAQPLSGVATHKVWFPFLAQATGRGEVAVRTHFAKRPAIALASQRVAEALAALACVLHSAQRHDAGARGHTPVACLDR